MAGDEGHGELDDAPRELGGVGIVDVRDPLPAEVRDPSFGFSVRGYDRHEVDDYVERVNRLIAELQVSGSPRAAVRHALDRVGAQTSGILQRARETAEEIIASAREEAEDVTRRAKAEAQDIAAAGEREADAARSLARTQAEEIVAVAEGKAEAERQRCREQIDALEREVAAVAEARRTALTDAKAIAAALREVVDAVDAPERRDDAPAAPDDQSGDEADLGDARA
jgi:DivIVA domain-containing protein